MTTEESKGAGPASVSTDLLERAAFEAWRESVPGGQFGLSRCTEPGYTHEYGDPFTQQQWVAWQAATKAEREACADRCEVICHKYMKRGNDPLAEVADECKDAIRARSNAEVSGRPLADGRA